MSRIRQRSHGPTESLAGGQRRQVREIARREFDRDGHTVPRHLLDRDEVDPYSEEVNPGLPGSKLAVNAVSSTELASGTTNPDRAVDSGHIKDGAVIRRTIPANAISSTELNSGAVGRPHIQANAVSGTELSSGAVGRRHVEANAISGTELNSGAVSRSHITRGAVSDNEIANVGWDKLNNKPAKFSPKSHDNKDHKINYARAGHKHSQSIKLMSQERRKAACELRERIRELPEGDMRDGLLVLMALAFDDPAYTLDSTLGLSAEEMAEKHEHETAWGEDDHEPITDSHPDLDLILNTSEA